MGGLKDELLKAIWHAFTALDLDHSGKVSKSQLKVGSPRPAPPSFARVPTPPGPGARSTAPGGSRSPLVVSARRGRQECGRAACSGQRGQRSGFGGSAFLVRSGRALGPVVSPLLVRGGMDEGGGRGWGLGELGSCR